MTYHSADLESLETRFRGNLINSLGGFKSLVLVGTTNTDGKENLAVFSSLFHLGANPALCGLIVRPAEPGFNTLGNIMATGKYTLNHVHPGIVRQAHQCSAKYPQGESEFSATGLHPEYRFAFEAPFVRESHIKFACELVQKTDIELNGTTLLIGKIIHVMIPDQLIGSDGFIDLEQAETVTCSGLDSYHTTQKIERLSYAKKDRQPEPI